MAFNGDASANIAMTNRSLRTIRTELEYLTDASVITPQQLSSILSQLPSQTPLHAPLLASASPNPSPTPISPMSNLNLNEKQMAPYNPVSNPAPPPPAYGIQHHPVLAVATALYNYVPTDAGDLAITPHDRITVMEYMNSDWWRGRNERTSLEGIFPRSYVTVVEEKSPMHAPVPQPTNYGNLPLAITQGGSSGTPEPSKQSKFEENGKKFGKKMGNAAIFGAGATIGSKIVDGIF